MLATRVLVVEDEPTVADVVVRYLERDGHDVEVAGDGPAALRAFDDFRPDLIVLDLMLPGLDGVDVCRRIRSVSNVPIVMLTARAGEADRLAGFDFGADDYVTKPFSPRELAARVEAVLRRTGRAEEGSDVLHHGDLRIDRRGRTVTTRAGELRLTAREFDLLLHHAEFEVVPFTADHLRLARDAYERYGKGRHAAALNLGDCCAYALARHAGEPLLFKGDDFPLTDVVPAV